MNRINKHLRSYRYALRGIYLAFRYENNMLFHLLAAIAVVTLNIILKIDKTDWLITLILIGLVITAEIFNTAIETLADRVTKEQDPLIAKTKDLASGAVLVICCFAAICAVIIYFPYFLALGF
ncbi:MAG: diacylglycerol kinase family protein [Pedobacter sp.]|uniref:diacylglycerol kinase family protein n=1 Tax=Pedobacter sp. TaxID=1411316 RepID=UPI002806F585|nr:diacylglycerol kinase family protein [Pedobacter sp.]MDQ8005364.1 diacylglycerol kinase family protein [Pedobacter sp.]